MKLMKEREIGMLLVEVGGCGRKLRKQREESVSQMGGKSTYSRGSGRKEVGVW